MTYKMTYEMIYKMINKFLERLDDIIEWSGYRRKYKGESKR